MPIELVEVGNPPEVKPKIFVGIALDRSSSMDSIQESVISNYNEQVDDIIQRSEKADLKISLVSFASDVQTHYLNSGVDSLVKLSKISYRPAGMTAMHHAMGVLIDKIEEETKDIDDYAVLFVTVSDGDDNTPDPDGKYTQAFVREKIKSLQDGKKWTFVFIGATKDKILIERELGISVNNIANFVVGNAQSYGNTSMRYMAARSNFLDGAIQCMTAASGKGEKFEGLTENCDFFAGVPENGDGEIQVGSIVENNVDFRSLLSNLNKSPKKPSIRKGPSSRIGGSLKK
jgi:uncharacterized protein YegL